jgi:hypothetical protein
VHPIHTADHITVNALDRTDQAAREIGGRQKRRNVVYFKPSVGNFYEWTELRILSSLSVSLVLETETQEDKQYYSDQ